LKAEVSRMLSKSSRDG